MTSIEEETGETVFSEFERGLGISFLILVAYVLLLIYNPPMIFGNDLAVTPLDFTYPFFALVCSPLFEYLRLNRKNHGNTRGISDYFWGSFAPVAIIVILWIATLFFFSFGDGNVQ